jgi:DNA-binding transcriptional ArsR family regulator
MDTILETYELETIEQLRAVADELRVRIVEQLAFQAMTVTQLAELFGEAPNKLHYHVRELERVGLLKKVETREKGAILEKYYRAVAKNIVVPKTLLSGMAPDEAVAMLNEAFFQGMARAAAQMMRLSPEEQTNHMFQISSGHYWMTTEEFVQVIKQVEALLKPYEKRRGSADEREQTVLWIAYPTALAGDQETEAVPKPSVVTTSAQVLMSSSSKPLKQKLALLVGTGRYTRWDLEEFLAQGETRNMYILGTCTFTEDISPDLVERAISSFHLKGKLNASPEVRAVLQRKGVEASKKNT